MYFMLIYEILISQAKEKQERVRQQIFADVFLAIEKTLLSLKLARKNIYFHKNFLEFVFYINFSNVFQRTMV